MRLFRKELLPFLVAVACVGSFVGYAFAFSSLDNRRAVVEEQAGPALPSARDFSVFETKLRRASQNGGFAETCGRGRLLADVTVHVAMQFPPPTRKETEANPGFAEAHVAQGDEAKALILDSATPTLWNVTGAPAAIILTGSAVVAHYPEGTPVFAPRFVDGCAGARWLQPPRGLAAPRKAGMFDSVMGKTSDVYSRRARALAKGALQRPYTAWKAAGGHRLFTF